MRLSYSYSPQKPFKRKKLPLKYTRHAHLPFGTWLKRFLSIALAIGMIGIMFFIGFAVYYSKDLPDPNKLLDRAVPLSTKIYDRTGNVLLYDIHRSQQRSLVSLRDIPDSLKHATIVAEDRGFYEHKGFDLKGILRALAIDVMRGRSAQGGSTITQQFIKNALLTPKKTLTRKIKELILAYQIEKRFNKDEILQLYLNEIPYGSTAYGVQAAAHMFFDKDVRNLSLAQGALLASLPKAPSYYSPWGMNRDKLIARQRFILDSMAEEGYASKEEVEDAKKEPLRFRKDAQSIKAPHFVFYIKDLLTDMYGDKIVEEGGLTVITTLDYDKQMIAENAIAAWGKKNVAAGASNAALISLEARTGEILAMVGSRDYFDESIDGSVNVTLRKRQPGSSFKPIVYASAFQKGYTPDTIVFDLKTNFDTTGTKPYEPQNYSGKEYGPVTLRKALAGSLNIASVKLLYLTGVATVVDFAKKIGYTSLQDPNRYGLALVLGGGEVTLFEHVAGFASFAREGKRVVPYGLARVKDKDGAALFEQKPPTQDNAYDPEIARAVTDILSDNASRAYIFGEKNYLTLPDRPAAVKTGTTNDFRDAWTIGYTPSITTGVWVGNNDNTPMKKGADGSKIAAPIWNEYMKKTLFSTTREDFMKPAPIQATKNILKGIVGDDERAIIDRSTGSLITEQTLPDNREERILHTIHDTLFYVDKDNPQGPLPEHPEADPQFAAWEKVVRDWAANLPAAAPHSQPPPHKQEGSPTISIESPSDNDTITSPNLTVRTTASSTQGIASVHYYLDDQLLDTLSSPPFILHTTLSEKENGFHSLTVKAFDATGQSSSASVMLNILLAK